LCSHSSGRRLAVPPRDSCSFPGSIGKVPSAPRHRHTPADTPRRACEERPPSHRRSSELPSRMRRLLHCSFHFVVHPRYAARQACRNPVRTIAPGLPLRAVRPPRSTRRVQQSAAGGIDVRRKPCRGDGPPRVAGAGNHAALERVLHFGLHGGATFQSPYPAAERPPLRRSRQRRPCRLKKCVTRSKGPRRRNKDASGGERGPATV
jgi:hypothetical protein